MKEVSRSGWFVLAWVVVPLLSPLSAQHGDELKKQLVTIERGLWEAWKNADSAPFAQALHEDFVSVGDNGSVAGKQAELAAISAGLCEIGSYSLSDWRAFPLGAETAVLLYRAQQEVTCSGTRSPSSLRVSTVFVREGDRWLVAAHQTTPMKLK